MFAATGRKFPPFVLFLDKRRKPFYPNKIGEKLLFDKRIGVTVLSLQTISFEMDQFRYKLESLILAQNERWRRA